MNTISLNVLTREQVGKKASKADRRTEKVPCVIYGGAENSNFSVDYNTLKKALYTDKFNVFELVSSTGNKKAIVKHIQFCPVTDNILHVDFQE